MNVIEEIKIENFRSIHNTTIKLGAINIIVGGNDSGKSNTLRAIRALFNPEYYFVEEDYPLSLLNEHENINLLAKCYIDEISSFKDLKKEIPSIFKVKEIVKSSKENRYKIKYMSTNGKKEYVRQINNRNSISLRKVFFIDLTENYASLSEDKWDDLESYINNTLSNLNENNKRRYKSTLNTFIKDYWKSDEYSSLLINYSESSELLIECTDKFRIGSSLRQRGTGFQAFIFLALKIFDAIYNNEEISFILIEEPERMLHPQGQSDFIKLIKYFSDEYSNIVFFITTHSPTIVKTIPDAKIHLVKKDENGHSIIDTKPHKSNWRELRNSLGMRASDSLLIGDITIIVEGTCEQIFIPKLLSKYHNIDNSLLNFISAEGVGNIESIVKIIKGFNANIFVIFDGDNAGKRGYDKLIRNGLLDENSIHIYENSENKEIAFEDIFHEDILFEVTKEVYKDKIDKDGIDFSKEDFENYSPNSDGDYDFSKKCWATRMSNYLAHKKVIDEKNDMDKISICERCIEKQEDCPVQINLLADKIISYIQKIEQ